MQTRQAKRQDLPFKEHSEGVFPETRLLLKDLLLENQPFAVPAILLQSFADEVQTRWQGKKQLRLLVMHSEALALPVNTRRRLLLWDQRNAQ